MLNEKVITWAKENKENNRGSMFKLSIPVIRVTPPKVAAAPTIAYKPGKTQWFCVP